MDKRLYFKNKKDDKLSGVLVSPDNKCHPVVIRCHGFHSTKDNNTKAVEDLLYAIMLLATYQPLKEWACLS
jgi:cephalosporin-C deacetylase-like acetyl esterase